MGAPGSAWTRLVRLALAVAVMSLRASPASATAVVAGGTVVDLLIQYSLSASNTTPIINITTYTSQSFTPSGGGWSSRSSTSSNFSSSSGSTAGSYTVLQVPEPGSLPLVAVGLALVAGMRGRRSGRRSEPAP